MAGLKRLVRACNPDDGIHIFWVDHEGMADVVPRAPAPSGWSAPSSLRVRLHGMTAADGILGPHAAMDHDAMTKLLRWLRATFELARGNETPDLDGLV